MLIHPACKRVAIFVIVTAILTACTMQSPAGATPTIGELAETPSVPPTYPPTAAATQAVSTATGPAPGGTLAVTPGITGTAAASPAPLSGPAVVVQQANNDVVLADAAGNTQVLTRNALHFNEAGISSVAGTANGTLYALAAPEPGATYLIYAVDAQGARPLNLGKTDGYGLAVWPGQDAAATLLAWGLADLTTAPYHAQLFTGSPADEQAKPVVDESRQEPGLLVPLRWSSDGKRLYFSKEPTGFGGYILFAGTSSLWVYDRGSGQAGMLLDQGQAGGLICINDLSPDEHLVAHTCANKMLTVLDITTGKSNAIQPPRGLPEFQQLGSARFSPDGKRLAYAIALGNPDKEQGWAVLSDGLEGVSSVIATSEEGDYYNVKTWLDDNTIVLQSYGSRPRVWAVSAAGGEPVMLAEGNYLAVMQP